MLCQLLHPPERVTFMSMSPPHRQCRGHGCTPVSSASRPVPGEDAAGRGLLSSLPTIIRPAGQLGVARGRLTAALPPWGSIHRPEKPPEPENHLGQEEGRNGHLRDRSISRPECLSAFHTVSDPTLTVKRAPSRASTPGERAALPLRCPPR